MKDIAETWTDLKNELFLYRSKALEGTPSFFGLRVYREQENIVVTYCLNMDEDQLYFRSTDIEDAINDAIVLLKKRNKGVER